MIDDEPNDSLQLLQNEILEAIARGTSLESVADLLCARVEQLAPTAVCSILTVGADGALHSIAAPSLPDEFSHALDGLPIGPHTGSCGTAAWRGEAVEVSDIATDPLWDDYRSLALPLGFLACWSSPIKARDGRVVGTFAFYYRTRRGPEDIERRIVAHCVHLCAIAIEHEDVQSHVRRLAFHDTLTGLPNRALFRERALQMLAALRPGHTFSLCYVDLDDFKGINEALGHRVGDRLLKGVADRLAACLGEGTFIARVAGDEFAVVPLPIEGQEDAQLLAGKISTALDDPFVMDGQKVPLGASIGIAQTSSADMALAELSTCADMALYEAKSEGHGRTSRVYKPEMAAAVRSRRSFRQDIRNAVDAGDFTVVYQPIVALANNQLTAVETLLRWHHPERGAVSPAVFIPIAEEMGLIGVLGDWVLREACGAAASWPRDITVCVNLSPLQFRKPGFVLDVISALHQTGLAPERLDLEITESALLARDVATRTALHDLHDFGVRLSLDDFGTGFSSLVSLRSFPFDKLKIDMSFVRDIGMDADSTAIVRAVIGLARDLCITTVAEGIETESQFEWLSRQGCREGQGYYFAEPMRGADLQTLLESPKRTEELIVPCNREARLA
jgi:diguanylate cyclase (GGDEF)-like protein